MIPATRMYVFGLLPSATVLVGQGAEWSTQTAWGLLGLLLAAFVIDGMLASRRPRLALERQTPVQLHVGQDCRIEWTIENRSPFPVTIRLRDQIPLESQADPEELGIEVAPHSKAVVSYSLRASRRGDAGFGRAVFRILGPLKLAWSQKVLDSAAPVRVLPHLANWKAAELAERHALVRQSGSHRYRWRGAGTVFESLRDYSAEDDIRWVDWKATARTQRPISRNFEVERHQQVILLVDASRMMTTYCGSRTKFDTVLEAAVLASRTVINQGDMLGMVVFSDRIDSYLHPRREQTQIRSVMEQLYNRQPRLVEPDFESALTLAATRAQRRSLIILFTDVTVIEAGRRMLAYLRRLSPRHLPLVVTIADQTIENLELTAPRSAKDLYRVGVANELMYQRSELLQQLRAAGAEILDCPADQIASRTIERYFELKRRLRL